MKNDLTKTEKKALWDIAEKCAGVPKGQKVGRWTHDDRVIICYSVLYKLILLNSKKEICQKKTNLLAE